MLVAQECNQNASVLIYVLPMYFSHALIGLGDLGQLVQAELLKTCNSPGRVDFPDSPAP